MLAIQKLVNDSTVDITPTLNVLHHALDNDIKLSSLSFTHDAKGLFGLAKASAAIHKSVAPVPAGQERGKVTIKFKFTLVGGSLDLEHKVQRAESLQKSLQQRFPGYDVRIASQFGSVTPTGQFKGEAGATVQPPGVKQEDSAEFEMTGPPL